MKEGQASRTADATTVLRAAESIKPEDERICYDPLARYFLVGKKYSLLFSLFRRSKIFARILLWVVEHEAPGAFGYVAVRCRYIDDYLRECVNDGIKQLVILGAGYDPRAYRFEALKKNVRVFEVDHPDTLTVKRERLKKIFGFLSPHVVYVPINFNSEKLHDRLFDSDYDPNVMTLFIWEGVTNYIDGEAVDETLAFVSRSSGQGSSIIFDYMYKSVLDGTSDLEEAKKVSRAHARRGEPNKFGIEEGTVEQFLKDRGFKEIINVTCEDFKRLYFKGPNKNRTVYQLFAIVQAETNLAS